MKAALIGVIALIVIAGGAYAFLKGGSKMPMTHTSTTTSTATQKSSAGTSSTTTSSGKTDNVTITANDDSATPETITVQKGDMVKLTFDVSSKGTYHGGLEFKSTEPAIDSGSIAEGSSGSVSFTATKSFKFTPYWYESNVQKDYFVTVTVQ